MSETGVDETGWPGLLAAARAVVTEQELGRVLRRLLEVSQELTGAGGGIVAIQGEPMGEVGEMVGEGAGRPALAMLRELPALRELLAGGPAVRMADVPGGSRHGVRSLLGVPVRIDGDVWGALCLCDPAPDRFGAGDEEVLEALAGWAAIAVRNARSQEEADQRRHELERSVAALEATFEIARAVGAETRMDRVLELIADRSRALVDASGVFILLPEGPNFVVAAIAGAIPDTMAGATVPGTASIARRVLREGRPARITARDMPQTTREMLASLHLAPQAALVVPLVFRGSNVGVIEALDRLDGPEFRDEDEHRLQAAAASAATAVATAQTVERERLHRSLQAAEDERGRWARELHDETLQALGGLRMTLSSARRLNDADALRAALDNAVEQLGLEIAELRALITELRPASLDQLGLEPALDALFERARRVYGLPVRALVELAGVARLDPEVETTIYRVIQESLNNAARHAQAGTVNIEVLERGQEIHVRVTDDGQGFDESVPSAGFGVLGMRERVTLAEGRLEIASGSDGTTVSAALPVRRAARSDLRDDGGLPATR